MHARTMRTVVGLPQADKKFLSSAELARPAHPSDRHDIRGTCCSHGGDSEILPTRRQQVPCNGLRTELGYTEAITSMSLFSNPSGHHEHGLVAVHIADNALGVRARSLSCALSGVMRTVSHQVVLALALNIVAKALRDLSVSATWILPAAFPLT